MDDNTTITSTDLLEQEQTCRDCDWEDDFWCEALPAPVFIGKRTTTCSLFRLPVPRG